MKRNKGLNIKQHQSNRNGLVSEDVTTFSYSAIKQLSDKLIHVSHNLGDHSYHEVVKVFANDINNALAHADVDNTTIIKAKMNTGVYNYSIRLVNINKFFNKHNDIYMHFTSEDLATYFVDALEYLSHHGLIAKRGNYRVAINTNKNTGSFITNLLSPDTQIGLSIIVTNLAEVDDNNDND